MRCYGPVIKTEKGHKRPHKITIMYDSHSISRKKRIALSANIQKEKTAGKNLH